MRKSFSLKKKTSEKKPRKLRKIAHPPRLKALRTDGTKFVTETLNLERDMVERCFARVEGYAKAYLDQAIIRILPIVTATAG